jgi:uncharacterized protein
MKSSLCKIKAIFSGSFMRQAALVLLVTALLLPGGGCTKKEQPPEALAKQGWVNDYADTLKPADKSRLADQLSAYEKETCHQVLVVIIPSLEGENIVNFSQRTFTAWEVGQSGFGNGILVSIALQEGSVRIETGSAFEWLIEQGTADRVLKEVMFPLFRQDRFVDGLEQGLAEIMQAARLKVVPADHRPDICRM